MQTNPEPLPEAKLVELDDACLGLDEKPLGDDEPTSFPIDAGELRELLRGYRAQAAFAEREARLVRVLEGLIDDEPCWYDHHGYCQTHYVTSPCEMAKARATLAALKDRTHG